jgi:hypothetical protein
MTLASFHCLWCLFSVPTLEAGLPYSRGHIVTKENPPTKPLFRFFSYLFLFVLYLLTSNLNLQFHVQFPKSCSHDPSFNMRPAVCLSVVFAIIFTPFTAAMPGKLDQGYRHVQNLDAFLKNMEVRFAEYDAPGWYVPM